MNRPQGGRRNFPEFFCNGCLLLLRLLSMAI
ncbi:hypothetical protein METH_10770 [Leisingera methylohalidivorans DSM 14336]|uniref:Uncharacterized protein n=1 Tax=Leisingera methylohalidivorans DSM 14336 TaxID=999552 RepID=V9VZ69_9RHOB|nr:hypothetical protein METH_10770 [Leisingera methylohalidivorans DSM 14336]